MTLKDGRFPWIVPMSGSQHEVWAELIDEDGATILYGFYRLGAACPGRHIHVGDEYYLVIDVDAWIDRRTDCVTITVRSKDNG
jgi:hypothetical protein